MHYIEFKGEKLPLKFSFIAMKNYNKESGKDIINGIDQLDFNDIELLFKCAYQSGCKSEGVEQKFTDIEAVLDDTYHEFIELIPKLMAVDKKKSSPNPATRKKK
jgi:hypothetical protein